MLHTIGGVGGTGDGRHGKVRGADAHKLTQEAVILHFGAKTRGFPDADKADASQLALRINADEQLQSVGGVAVHSNLENDLVFGAADHLGDSIVVQILQRGILSLPEQGFQAGVQLVLLCLGDLILGGSIGKHQQTADDDADQGQHQRRHDFFTHGSFPPLPA